MRIVIGLEIALVDGITDAAALKLAQVGIAMGGIGSDIAIDAVIASLSPLLKWRESR